MDTLVYSNNKYVPAYDLCRYYGVSCLDDVANAKSRLKRVGLMTENFQLAVYADWENTVGKSIPANRVGRESLKYQQWERESYLIWQGHLPDLLTQDKPAKAEASWIQDVLNQYMVNGDDFPLGEILKYAKKEGILHKLQFHRELYTRHLHNAIKCVKVLKQYGLFK
jgi:hypothetical protein